MKQEKKAQSALEYLMTYGWALVVIVVVVASLVLLVGPGSVSGSTVNGFTQGIILENSLIPQVASEPLKLVFFNQTGRSLHNMDFIITDSQGGDIEGTVINDSGQKWSGESTDTFSAGAKTTITFTPNSDWTNSSAFNITITYTDQDGFSRSSSGTMNTSFSSGASLVNCGNGELDSGEECDGTNFDGETCSSLGAGDFGSLSCTGSCTINTSACHNCGNGTADSGEECDGSSFPIGPGCENYGFGPGENVTCTPFCTVNTHSCSVCGNGVLDEYEECDPGPPEELGGLTCVDLGYTDGDLACNSTCSFDESACIGTGATCPNGEIEGLEVCDWPDFGGETCESLGFVSGELVCNWDCSTILTDDCESCGNGSCEPGYPHYENFDNCIDCSALCGNATCDLNIGEDFGNCPEDCNYLCGNGTCEPLYGENETNCVDDCGECVPDTCDDLSQFLPCGLIEEPVCSTTIDCGECEYDQYECDSETHSCVCIPSCSMMSEGNCGIIFDFTCFASASCGCPTGYTCGSGGRSSEDTCTPITDGCEDECSVQGIKHCLDDTTIQTCGHFDEDMCLEWSNSQSCSSCESISSPPFAQCNG